MTNGITNDEANAIGNFIDAVSKLNIPCVSGRSEQLILIKLKIAMDWIDIKEQEPNKTMANCEVKTNKGRELIVDYDEEFGLFLEFPDDENRQENWLGWKDNGEQPELVTHWKLGTQYGA